MCWKFQLEVEREENDFFQESEVSQAGQGTESSLRRNRTLRAVVTHF